MSWRIFGNVFKLIGHNLENMEFLTEFRIICSKVPFTLSTQLMFQIAVALFRVNLRNIRKTIHPKWHNLEYMEHSVEYFRKLETWFQTVLNGQNTPLHELEDLWNWNKTFKNSVEYSVEDSIHSRLCYISSITFPKILKLMEGYIWTIWNGFEPV